MKQKAWFGLQSCLRDLLADWTVQEEALHALLRHLAAQTNMVHDLAVVFCALLSVNVLAHGMRRAAGFPVTKQRRGHIIVWCVWGGGGGGGFEVLRGLGFRVFKAFVLGVVWGSKGFSNRAKPRALNHKS